MFISMLSTMSFKTTAAADGSYLHAFLPHEILALIVSVCEPSVLFPLTHVNTTFRQLVYENLPPIADIPRPLAVHLLNNQKPDVGGPIYNDVFIGSRSSSGHVISTDSPASPLPSPPRKRRFRWEKKEAKKMYAPRFSLEEYKPRLLNDRMYIIRLNMLAGTNITWETSNIYAIDMLRLERDYEKERAKDTMLMAKNYRGKIERLR